MRTSWDWRNYGITFKGFDARKLTGAFIYGVLGWFAANALYYLMLKMGFDDTSNLVVQALEGADTHVELVGMAFLIVFLAPVVEELLFRGVIFGIVKRRNGVGSAVIASAIPFTILHGSPVQYPGIMIIAIILALLYHRTGLLAVSITSHAVFNGMSFVLFLAAGPDFLHP